jgi:hypothetical protein
MEKNDSKFSFLHEPKLLSNFKQEADQIEEIINKNGDMSGEDEEYKMDGHRR